MNADLRSRILFLSQWILVCKKQKNLHMNSPTNQHISFIRLLQLFKKKRMLRCDYQVNSNIRDKPFIPDSSLVPSCHWLASVCYCKPAEERKQRRKGSGQRFPCHLLEMPHSYLEPLIRKEPVGCQPLLKV